MSPAVVLDSTPLGILCHPRSPPHVVACRRWLADLCAAGRRVIIPEIADYEVRRELIRMSGFVALANLDGYALQLEYLPITTTAMRRADVFSPICAMVSLRGPMKAIPCSSQALANSAFSARKP